MRIIGCDLHARQQALTMLDTITGVVVNRTLLHEGHQVREFYSELPRPVLVIWMPSKEQLDLRALLLHRHPWLCLRTRTQNALQAIALANGLRRGPGLCSYDGQAKIAVLVAFVARLVSTERAASPVSGDAKENR
jgi:hypothetical protein